MKIGTDKSLLGWVIERCKREIFSSIANRIGMRTAAKQKCLIFAQQRDKFVCKRALLFYPFAFEWMN